MQRRRASSRALRGRFDTVRCRRSSGLHLAVVGITSARPVTSERNRVLQDARSRFTERRPGVRSRTSSSTRHAERAVMRLQLETDLQMPSTMRNHVLSQPIIRRYREHQRLRSARTLAPPERGLSVPQISSHCRRHRSDSPARKQVLAESCRQIPNGSAVWFTRASFMCSTSLPVAGEYDPRVEVAKILDETKLEPSKLKLEITEALSWATSAAPRPPSQICNRSALSGASTTSGPDTRR